MQKNELTELLQNINYMDMQELKAFCNLRGIPYVIHIELPDGKIKKTAEMDRKGIIIERIKHFVKTGKIKKPTVFPCAVVSNNGVSKQLSNKSRVLYGEYKNKDAKILRLMKKLTKNEFEFGAIAQEVTRACWTKGQAPTYEEFAKLWLAAKKAHTEPNPEWAFLADRKRGTANKDWKKLRIEKARQAIEWLNLLKFE